ncbi:MAG: transcriptional regulator [Opitutaceae bacterium]
MTTQLTRKPFAPIARVAAREHRQDASDCGRATLRRVLYIHERLGNQHAATAVSLARELEVSERTVKRDVEFMREQLGAPIDWDPAEHTYVYSRPCDLLPLLRLDAAEALALTLAGKTFAAWHGTPLGQSLTAALHKIAGVVGGAVSLPVSEISSLISPAPGDGSLDAEVRHFPTALEAIQRRRVLRIVYQKPKRTATPETRHVHPLHLACLDHRWVLIAHDPGRSALRNFLLGRIQAATATAASFEAPASFDVQAYLRGSLGRFTGHDDIPVRVLFDAELGPYLRERPWHPSQTLQERTDGRIEATYRLNHLTDLTRRLLACGSKVEALAPDQLRQTLYDEATALAQRHRSRPINP